MTDKISVVIPTKDRRDMLARVIATHLRQDEVGEVVVVVDGSTDGTLELLAELQQVEPRLRVMSNPINKGTPYTKNRGVASASLSTIFLGEDDVEVTDGFFRTLLAHYKETQSDLICGRNVWRYIDETAEDAIRRKNQDMQPYEDLRTLESDTGALLPDDRKVTLAAAPILGSAEVFRSVGFDERYRGNFWREETDFQIAAQSLGYTITSCPHAVCFNFIIPNDRSGSHASAGLVRLFWIARNNLLFARKHREFLKTRTRTGSPLGFTFRVVCKKARVELVLPALVRWRARVRRFIPHVIAVRSRFGGRWMAKDDD